MLDELIEEIARAAENADVAEGSARRQGADRDCLYHAGYADGMWRAHKLLVDYANEIKKGTARS